MILLPSFFQLCMVYFDSVKCLFIWWATEFSFTNIYWANAAWQALCYRDKKIYLSGDAVWILVIVVQSLSCVRLCETLWTAACQASLFFPIAQSLLRFTSVEAVMLSNHLILCCSLLLPSIFQSGSLQMSQLFTSGGPKYWSFNFSINPSNEYSGLISFRID